jgi:hypothetical protein
METETSTTPQSGTQSTQVESEDATTRIMLEAARVAVAKALAEKQNAASTREREETKVAEQGSVKCG